VGGLEIASFSDEHLDAAAKLLAARHARHRQAQPLLASRYASAEGAREALEAAWRRDSASGAAGLRDGVLAGFLVGAPRDDAVWGANVWVESGGHAAERAEDVRDLYAFAAARWVDEGRTRHYGLVPAGDRDLVDAWFRLSFGVQHVYGLRAVPAVTAVGLPAPYTIRPPGPQDVDGLIDVELALPEHQLGSPVFTSIAVPGREELRREWLSTLAGTEEDVFVAFTDDRPVACWGLAPLARDEEHRLLVSAAETCFLGFAATLPGHRGAGVGTALTDACLACAAARGYTSMLTDWRATNLLSSRFWPRRGFSETFLRLYRSIP
jgi:GNAT superfamily N-acetyltransferase